MTWPMVVVGIAHPLSLAGANVLAGPLAGLAFAEGFGLRRVAGHGGLPPGIAILAVSGLSEAS